MHHFSVLQDGDIVNLIDHTLDLANEFWALSQHRIDAVFHVLLDLLGVEGLDGLVTGIDLRTQIWSFLMLM